MLEGIVNNGLQHQSVTNVRRAAEMEHVYAPQGWVSVTQATESETKRKKNKVFVDCLVFWCFEAWPHYR